VIATRAVVVLLALVAGPTMAQPPAPDVSPALEPVQGEPAFVEHRLTLQLSDPGAEKQSLVLSVAFNVLKAYGPDKVAIDVVAFGPGIDLLRDGNPNAERIHSLVTQGVRFDACMNTVTTIERETGKPYPLNPLARHVEAGVVRILNLAEHGYTTVRP
jgi:intracellular sulfur oxidation DsrE/DsrF family protein